MIRIFHGMMNIAQAQKNMSLNLQMELRIQSVFQIIEIQTRLL